MIGNVPRPMATTVGIVRNVVRCGHIQTHTRSRLRHVMIDKTGFCVL